MSYPPLSARIKGEPLAAWRSGLPSRKRLRWSGDPRSAAHRHADVDAAVDVSAQLAEDAALLLGADQGQALVAELAQLLELEAQEAHLVVDDRPVDLVVGQAAHLVGDVGQLLGE